MAIGRGVADQEQLALCRQLAYALGATLSCSRPPTEGKDALMAGEPYIGASGINVKPDLFVGIGISGQTQHFIGMGGSKRIVVINKDANASFFNRCDYGIVGDMNEVVPAIINAL